MFWRKAPPNLEHVRQEEPNTNQVTIQDLPDEMLRKFLSFLDVDDQKSASRVCQRWSDCALNWSSVQLVVRCDCKDNPEDAEYLQTLLASDRRYKHLVFEFAFTRYDLLKDIVTHFSQSLESIKIVAYSKLREKLELFAIIAAQCPSIKYLHFDGCYFKHEGADLEFVPMNKLKALYLVTDLPELIANMQEVTPNVTKLDMEISYHRQAVDYLLSVSSQLLELKIWCRQCGPARWPIEYFLTVCSMDFPLLKKLDFHLDDIVLDDTCRDLRDAYEKIETICRFFQRLPQLKETIMRCRINDGVLRRLCQSFKNLEFLCLRMDSFQEESFRAICQLKHLKRLRIESPFIDVPPVLSCPSLRTLSLCSTRIEDPKGFNRFLLHAFPGLTNLELLYLSLPMHREEFELYSEMCKNLVSLERLVVYQRYCKMKLSPLLSFCISLVPRELRLKCYIIEDNHQWKRIPYNSVETLILDAPEVSLNVLKKIIRSMHNLRRLELVRGHFVPEVIRELQDMFPLCEIREKRKLQLEEPL